MLAASLLLAALGSLPATVAPAPVPYGPELPPEHQTVRGGRLPKNRTVAQSLVALGVSAGDAEAALASLKGLFDFRKARAGDPYRVRLKEGALQFFEYWPSSLEVFRVRRIESGFIAERRPIPLEHRRAAVALSVQSSLYEAALASGQLPELALALADVFAWDLDFYTDVRKGDQVKAVVEETLANGRVVGYGEILAAEYNGQAVGHKRVFEYAAPGSPASYYEPDGSAARKTFLKSPLKFTHISSRYGMRVHPLLKYMQAHEGVDYVAPTGTPIWAVADGRVTRAGFLGANGNLVCLRHANALETCYCHLSRYGENIHVGSRVAQKQVIGYVGTTGRSTGPHLHFALKKAGSFVNPLAQKFPRADPLPPRLLADFKASVAPLAQELDGLAPGVGG